jgi:hypothetical protein
MLTCFENLAWAHFNLGAGLAQAAPAWKSRCWVEFRAGRSPSTACSTAVRPIARPVAPEVKCTHLTLLALAFQMTR